MYNSTSLKTVLKNGLTIVSEHIPAYRSISIGVWINTGSRAENHQEQGIVHFIEHLLFKGTSQRSALQIAQSLEELGGYLNAFTAKEETCFHVHILDSHLKIAVEVLADMICNSLFLEKDISLEKQVIIEEINSVKDTPDEYIFDVFQEKCFPDQPLGFPILGIPDTVLNLNCEKLKSFYNQHFKPDNMIISVAGNVNHEELVDLVNNNFIFNGKADKKIMAKAEAARNIHFNLEEALNQSHICLGSEAVSYFHEKRYDLVALNTYLGGGLSSRLFQVLREELAYVYSVYSFLDFYKDTGVIGFYLGTDEKNKDKALDKLYEEIKNVVDNKLSTIKVNNLKEQILGGFFLSLESTFKRMTRLAKNELYFGRQISIEELTAAVDNISPESINAAAGQYLDLNTFNSVVISPGK
jgi:predicted Zn-dependent peptidase